MSKIKKWFSDFYNNCGYIFILVMLSESLTKLTISPEAASMLDKNVWVSFFLSLVYLLATIGALNVADRINSNLKIK